MSTWRLHQQKIGNPVIDEEATVSPVLIHTTYPAFRNPGQLSGGGYQKPRSKGQSNGRAERRRIESNIRLAGKHAATDARAIKREDV